MGIGVFEMIVLIVLISTAGKVLSARQRRPQIQPGLRPEELEQLADGMSELHARVAKLEEERDFYRALLESPKRDEMPKPGEERGPTP